MESMRRGNVHARVWRRLESEYNSRRVGPLTSKFASASASSRRSVVGDAPVIVSLTTHGERFESVHLAIESIAAGSLLPSRIILWLDDESLLNNLSPGLRELVKRGLEVKLSSNLGPHTKYFPTLREFGPGRSALALATADDDILYPQNWLARLVRAWSRSADRIHCWRAHEMSLVRPDTLAPYQDWKPAWTRAPRSSNFLTGVSGVIYPKRMLRALALAGEGFLTCSPKADDVWLNYVAVQNDIRVQQVRRIPRHFPVIGGTQQTGLFHSNAIGTRNDEQISRTFDPATISRISADLPLVGR